MKRSPLRATPQPAAITAAQQAAMERDNHRCLLCGTSEMLDPAHVLPRRWKHERDKIHNIATLCRRCHAATETVQGRVRLLVLLAGLYEYEYEHEPYAQYWRLR